MQCSLCSISKSQLMASASVLPGPDITFTIFSLVYTASLDKELNLILSCFSLLASNSLSSISLLFHTVSITAVPLHDNTCSLFFSCSLCSLHLSLSPFPSPSTCERSALCSGREVPFLLRLNWHAHSRLRLARKGVNGTEADKSLLRVIKRWWEVIPSEEPASCCHTQAHIPDLPLICTLPP